eukprot:scaffold373145_cov43-Attheya_sp.AAC.1
MTNQATPKPIFRSSIGILCDDKIHVVNTCSTKATILPDNDESYNDLDYGSSYTVRPLSQQSLTSDDEGEYYFDPSDEYVVRVLRNEHGDKEAYGKAFHLSCERNKEGSTSRYTRDSYIEGMLSNLSDDELFGREIEFNSLDYALVQARKLQCNDYEIPTDKEPSFLVYPDDDGD